MAEPIRVVRGGVFIPKWENADRDESEKIKIHYRFLSFAEQQALIHYDDLGKTMAYDSRMIAAMVTKVENLEIAEVEEVKKISNGQEMIDDPGVEELCLEFWIHVRGLSAVDKKK